MRSFRIVLMLAGVVLALGAPATVLQGAATTFTVTKTADTNDGTCDADCSLREAITAANANAGTDTIAFAIPGAGPHTIAPTSALPTISDPVIIDGYTQSGASPNTNSVASGLGLNTVLKIELDGSVAGAGVDGLHITAGNSTVRGLVINRFDRDGIELAIGGDNHFIEGNFIGTDVAGAADLGNSVGIRVRSANTTVGGQDPKARNLISGNVRGIATGTGSDGTVIQGNLVGTDKLGLSALPNDNGIQLRPIGVTVGGTTTEERNVISGNTFDGVFMGTTATVGTGSAILGNFIGVDVGGVAALGNGDGGVRVEDDDVKVGGLEAGAGNIIAFNGNDGVGIRTSTGTAVLGNRIFSNGDLGIDLDFDSVTANDAGDADAGPNNLQNFPVLTSAVTGGGTGVTVAGTLDSAATSAFRVEFFANAACDPSGNGEGETFLGAATATTDSGGTAVFSVGLTKTVSVGAAITATATDPADNTSEFSACQTAIATVPVPGASGAALVGLAALLAVAFAWAAVRRARVTAPAR